MLENNQFVVIHKLKEGSLRTVTKLIRKRVRFGNLFEYCQLKDYPINFLYHFCQRLFEQGCYLNSEGVIEVHFLFPFLKERHPEK